MEIYGFAMLDMGHDFKQIHPDWYDTLRLTRLPSFKDEFGKDNSTFAGVRQSRLGVRTSTPDEYWASSRPCSSSSCSAPAWTPARRRSGCAMRGVSWASSPRASTGARLPIRTRSPTQLEYWGPTGLAWYRNVQFRWTPVADEHSNLMFALERPGASGDQGVYADRIELQNINARFPIPDFTAAYKSTQDWGYARVAGQLRKINWDDMLADQFELSGGATGWGLNFSTNLKVGSQGCHSGGVRGG